MSMVKQLLLVLFVLPLSEISMKHTVKLVGFFSINNKDKGWNSAGMIPAAKMAIDDINANSDVLREYTLEVDIRDVKCNSGFARKVLVESIEQDPGVVMILDGACSISSEAVAEVSHYWNLVQVGAGASSPHLSNKNDFPLYFRTNSPDSRGNPATLALLKHFKWKRVAIVYENEVLFSLNAISLEELLREEDISVVSFEVFNWEPDKNIQKLKLSDARIIIGLFYEDKARALFCAAFQFGLVGLKYQWILPGWFRQQWWSHAQNNTKCTPAQIKLAAGNYMTVQETAWSRNHTMTISGQTTEVIRERYVDLTANSSDLFNDFAGLAYDAAWAIALTLNISIPLLRKYGFSLECFNHSNPLPAGVFKRVLSNLSFIGASGDVKFDANGDRIGDMLMEQMQGEEEVVVGRYILNQGVLVFNETNNIYWQGGSPPLDGPVHQTELLYLPTKLVIIISSLCLMGILLSLAFLSFNIKQKHHRVIKMSSPRINNITIFGCVIIYVTVVVHGIDGRFVGGNVYTKMCQLKAWLTSMGFNFAYGAIFAKTWRVYMIFSKKTQKLVIRDEKLIAMVTCVVGVDVVIHIIWQLLDPPFRCLILKTVTAKQHEAETSKKVYFEYCSSNWHIVWCSVIYGEKGILLFFGAFLAWSTRHVLYPGLNDSQSIGLSVYTNLVLCLIGLPVVKLTMTLPEVSFAAGALVTLVSTTITLCLIFVPKIIELRNNRVCALQVTVENALLVESNLAVQDPNSLRLSQASMNGAFLVRRLVTN